MKPHMSRLLCVYMTSMSLLFCILIEANAQSNWEGGLRYGDEVALEATIPFSEAPRLHGAMYLGQNQGKGFGLGGYFNWMINTNKRASNGLSFYPGIGPEFYFGDLFNAGLAADLGMEYSFRFPLTLGFDWRPSYIFTNDIGRINDNWGFVARFRLGQGTSLKSRKKLAKMEP